MRRMAPFLATLVAVGLAGCGSEPAPEPSPPGVPVSVFLRDDATEAQRQAVEETLRAAPGASGITFETREQAYERFAELFQDQPELVEDVAPEMLPESFRFEMADRAAAESLATELQELPGVEEVIVMPETPLPTWLPTR